MIVDKIRESQLQSWFELAARERRLGAAIQNVAELTEQLRYLEAAGRWTDSASRGGLARAKAACEMLDDTDPLSANQSIAPPGVNQMRPDLVLFSESANYVLVELKTQRKPERQGVQELLAYSTAVKMQAPYINDFIYVIVSNAWDALLQFSVRSLILDGKRVLPLRWTRLPSGEFTLEVLLELFEFDFVQPYDPMMAMSTSTLAVSCPTNFAPKVRGYLTGCANEALAACRQLQQSGFVLLWASRDGFNQQILSITLATVNQHWLQSEYLPSDYGRMPTEDPVGFAGLIHRSANAQRDAIHGSAQYSDIFGIIAGNEAALRFFPQSSLSFEVLKRSQRRAREDWLRAQCPLLGIFDLGLDYNLKLFVETVCFSWHELSYCWPFGELADYAQSQGRTTIPGFDDLVELLDMFQEFKGYPPRATPGAWPAFP